MLQQPTNLAVQRGVEGPISEVDQEQAGRPAWALDYVWLPALAVIAAGSMLTAPRGAAAAPRWPVARLRRVFAALLASLGLYMVTVALRG